MAHRAERLRCGRVSVGTLAREARRPLAGVRTARARAVLSSPTAAALGGLVVLAAVLRFYRIGHQGFWFDEANASNDLHFSPGKMLGLLPQNQTTPPLYYCIGWVWARLFGFSEAPLRSLSAIAGIATVPVFYAAGAKLISRRAGLIAAALCACNPFLVWYSQEARPYELLVLTSAASLLAFAYARERPDGRSLTAWAIVSMVALSTHYYALVIVVPEALWLLAAYRRERAVYIAVAVVGLCGLALLPLAIAQNHTGNASWIAPIPLLPRLGQVVPNFLIGFQAPAQDVLLRVAEAMILVALALLAFRADRIEQRRALAVGALAADGLLLNLLLIAVGIDDLITRNVIALWLPAALFVAGGLGCRRSGALGIAASAVLCVIGIVAVFGVAVDRKFQRPDWRAVGRVLGARPAPGVGARAVLVQRYRNLLPLSLYVPGLKFWPLRGTPSVTELDIVSISAPRVNLCWWGAACNLSGSQMQSSYALAGFHVLWRRQAFQFSVMRLVSPTPVALTRAEVSRALTTTRFGRDELLIQR
jgi:hypothetical protein